jgi:hypothetical protein
MKHAQHDPLVTVVLDAYVGEVSRHLPLAGAARRAALDDLGRALREASDALGPQEAVRSFGPACATAERLASESTEGPRSGPVLFGIPLGLDPRTMGSRLRATMDPAGPWFVPRVVGAGWDLNVGRALREVGFVRGDDLDEDVAAAIPASRWRLAAAAGVAGYAAALAVSVTGIRRMRQAPLHWPATGPANAWGSPRIAFGRTLALGAVGVGLVLASQRSRASLANRLGCLSGGVVVIDLAAGMTALTRWGGHRSGAWVLLVLGGSIVRAMLLTGGLVRSGVANVAAHEAGDSDGTR